MTNETHERDLLIVGAGPAGLYAAHYAGFRGTSVTLVDAVPEPGGQIGAGHPETQVFDVAGSPSVKDQGLIDDCAARAARSARLFPGHSSDQR